MNDAVDPKVLDYLARLNIQYRVFPCEPQYADTDELIQQYGFVREQIVNTIIVSGKGRFAASAVLATCKVDVNRKVCQLLGVKRASFASADQTTEMTGMMIGGVTIFGLPEAVPVFVDQSVMDVDEILVGGGNRSSKLLLHPEELRKIPNLSVITQLGILRSE